MLRMTANIKCGGFGLLAMIALAAMAGQVVIDFSVPEYTPDGRLKSHIRGDRALIQEDGNTDIENLRLDIFPENGQNMQMTAKQCFFRRQQGIVESSSSVQILTPGLLITGTGFYWNLSAESGVIQSNVSVTILNSQGLYPREP